MLIINDVYSKDNESYHTNSYNIILFMYYNSDEQSINFIEDKN